MYADLLKLNASENDDDDDDVLSFSFGHSAATDDAAFGFSELDR